MASKQNWKKQLKADPTDWLLEENDPCVRHLALRDIAGADEKAVKAARRKAHREGPIAKILNEMNPEGCWIRPGPVYANKCRGTVWSVISLAQLGASVREDKRVNTACNYILDNAMAEGGQFSNTGKPESTFDCLHGNLLASLMDLACADKRLDKAYEWIARAVTGIEFSATDPSIPQINYLYKTSALFSCKSNKYRPCAWGGAKIMCAFSRLPAGRRTYIIKRAIKTGVDYFFAVDPSTAAFPEDNPTNPDRRWWKLGFPVFWATDILQVAEALTLLGYGKDPRLAMTLDMIREKQDNDGRWNLELDQYRNRMWQNYGSKGKPSKRVTLRALRVLKLAGE